MKRLFSLLALMVLAFTLTAQNKATAKADALFAQNNFALAANEYGKLVAAAEKSNKPPAFDLGYVYNRLGESHMNLRRFAAAEVAFTKAQEKGARGSRFLMNFGDVLLVNGKAEQALNLFQQVLTQNPENADAAERVRRAEFNIAALNNPNVALHPVVFESMVNTPTNNQISLAWYNGNLLFSSDRAKPMGSPKPDPTTRFFYSKDSKIQALQPMAPPAADRALAYDDHTKTFYAMRCPAPAKGAQRNCNIYAYQMDPKGKFGSPMRQSFHDNAALVGFPTLSSDGNVMFFSIQKGGKTNLYVAKRTGANTWSTPIMLPAVINTENGAESYPQLFRDSLLFFASTGHPGMGGFDIFYTKITVDGEGHAVSGRSDLSKLEFSTPENLGVPINSGADDFSMVLQQNGNGGFFISNRTANGANRNNIYRFNQEPYIFSEPGKDLAPRLPATVETVTVTSETSTTTQPLAVQTAVGRTDTVFIERIVEIPVERIVEVPVEKIVEKEVFISGGDDEQAAIERLKQTDELRREISRLNAQVSQLTERKSQLSNDLTTCQGALAQERTRPAPATPTTTSEIYRVDAPAAAPVHTAPASQPTTSTGIVYRVQVAASRNTPAPGEYRATFAALHRAMPNLRMETVLGVDGYHRYVTVPFATFAEADAVRRRIQALGYQCFVSGYKGNNRVSMSVR